MRFFSVIHDSLQLKTSLFRCQIIKLPIERPHSRQPTEFKAEIGLIKEFEVVFFSHLSPVHYLLCLAEFTFRNI